MASKLSLSGATVGYDKAGVKQLLKDVKAKVITDSKTKLTKGLTELNNTVNEIWVGAAADTFKANMKKDVNSIKSAMDAAYNVLVSEINAVENSMSNLDKNLVKKR